MMRFFKKRHPNGQPRKDVRMWPFSVVTKFAPALFLLLVWAGPVKAETTCCEELQRQLRQQNERIERLEEALSIAQSQGGAEPSRRRSASAGQPDLSDPLIGTWQCTNNVFAYTMTFFADGLMLQEATSFGPMREVPWKRLSADEVLLDSGIKIHTRFSGDQRMTAENLSNLAVWECQRLSN